MQTGRRTQLLTYLLLIAINLLVVPNWFSPGHFELTTRLMLAALNIGIIAFCAWRISRILGVNPFSRLKRPRYAPYAAPEEDEREWAAERERFPRAERDAGSRATGDPAGQARAYGQAGQFEEYDPYDEAPFEGPDGERPGPERR